MTAAAPAVRTHSGAKRALQWIALGLALAASAVFVLVPFPGSVYSDSAGSTVTETNNMLGQYGPGILITFAIPVVLTAVPLTLRGGRALLIVSVICVVLLGLFVFVALLSIGLFFVPALVCAIVAACLPGNPRT